MLMDVTFLILSTCLHLNDTDFYVSRQCQKQLTTCYSEAHSRQPTFDPNSIVTYCLASGHVNWKFLEKK